MSVQVMSLVWRSTLPTAEKMVLLVIADHAADDGTNAWPGVATIARKASMSERTVQRHLRTLEEQGLIAVEAQGGGTKSTRNDRRPNRYDINLRALHGVTTGALSNERGVTVATSRGDSYDVTGCQMEQHGVTAVSPYPSIEPSSYPSVEPSNTLALDMTHDGDTATIPEIVSDDDFSHFWSAYPRHTQRATAARRWGAMPKRDRLAALDALPQHCDYWRRMRVEPRFIPHPATWLNQRRWEDELDAPQQATLGLSKAAQRIQEMMRDAAN